MIRTNRFEFQCKYMRIQELKFFKLFREKKGTRRKKREKKTGDYGLIKVYKIALYSGPVGHVSRYSNRCL